MPPFENMPLEATGAVELGPPCITFNIRSRVDCIPSIWPCMPMNWLSRCETRLKNSVLSAIRPEDQLRGCVLDGYARAC